MKLILSLITLLSITQSAHASLRVTATNCQAGDVFPGGTLEVINYTKVYVNGTFAPGYGVRWQKGEDGSKLAEVHTPQGWEDITCARVQVNQNGRLTEW